MAQLVLYLAVIIALAGVLAMVEAAVLSISRGEVEELATAGKWGARRLKYITQDITHPMVVIVVLTNTIYVVGPVLTGRKAVELFGDAAIAVVTAALTFGTIVFSEIVPKSLGSHYAPVIARLAAPTIYSLVYLLYPLVLLLEWLAGLFKAGARPIGTEGQIRSLAEIGRKAGYIEPDEGQLIRRAFILNDRTAEEIMTPVSQMVAIPDSLTISEAAREVLRHQFSRYPLMGRSVHDLKGLVMCRDILQALAEKKGVETVVSLRRPCPEFSPRTKADELLVRFQRQQVHLAIVRDDATTLGLVTLEDVLEELVGEIEDETDLHQPIHNAAEDLAKTVSG